MGEIVKSIVKKTGDKGDFWIAVIGDREVMAFDAKIKDFEGKECPYPIGTSKSGKFYVQFPKDGGFKPGGGFQRGKSDKEIYSQIFTMSMAYAKDLIVAEINAGAKFTGAIDIMLVHYQLISGQILADLAKIAPTESAKPETPQAPPQKTETKPPQSVPQERSASDTGTMTVKEKLKKEMWQLLQNKRADTDEHFRSLLIEITGFEGKDKETKQPTGKMVFIDDINDGRFSDKWAQKALGVLRKLVEQEEVNASLKDDDIAF